MENNHACLIQALEAAETLSLHMQPQAHIRTAKGERDFALDADYAVEQRIRDILQASRLPILGEEHGWSESCDTAPETFWAIDPIDGTINYARGLPLWGISIALVHQRHPIMAGITFPALQQRYTALERQGAFLNDEKISVSQTSSLQQAVVGVGDFAIGIDSMAKNQTRLAVLNKLASQTLRVRMLGSAALQLAWVAAGHSDLSITLSNKAWDVQAGVLLVREAGGEVYDADGNAHNLNSNYTLASNIQLKSELLQVLAE